MTCKGDCSWRYCDSVEILLRHVFGDAIIDIEQDTQIVSDGE